jgi:hypothetical protein
MLRYKNSQMLSELTFTLYSLTKNSQLQQKKMFLKTRTKIILGGYRFSSGYGWG